MLTVWAHCQRLNHPTNRISLRFLGLNVSGVHRPCRGLCSGLREPRVYKRRGRFRWVLNSAPRFSLSCVSAAYVNRCDCMWALFVRFTKTLDYEPAFLPFNCFSVSDWWVPPCQLVCLLSPECTQGGLWLLLCSPGSVHPELYPRLVLFL